MVVHGGDTGEGEYLMMLNVGTYILIPVTSTAVTPAWFAGVVLQVINGLNDLHDIVTDIRASLISMKSNSTG
jgi:hypothetical protein